MILLEVLKRLLLIGGGTLAIIRGAIVPNDMFVTGGLVLLGLYLIVCGVMGERRRA